LLLKNLKYTIVKTKSKLLEKSIKVCTKKDSKNAVFLSMLNKNIKLPAYPLS